MMVLRTRFLNVTLWAIFSNSLVTIGLIYSFTQSVMIWLMVLAMRPFRPLLRSSSYLPKSFLMPRIEKIDACTVFLTMPGMFWSSLATLSRIDCVMSVLSRMSMRFPTWKSGCL